MNQTAVQLALLAAGIGGKRLGAAAYGGNGLGADIAGSVGAFALQYALGALLPGPKTRTQGSRLSDLQQTFSTYGVTIPIVFGDAVVGGNYIWTPKPALLEQSRTETTGSSKGLGGQNILTTYQYYLRAAIGICEGVVRGVKRIWVNDQLVLDQGTWMLDGSTTAYQLGDATPDDGVYIAPGVRLYFGTETQLPCPYIESFEGAGRVSAHRGMAYIVLENFPMEKFGNGSSVVNFKFEVSRYVAVEAPQETNAELPELLIPPKPVWQSAYDQTHGNLVFRVGSSQDVEASGMYGPYQEQPLFVQRSTDTGLAIDVVELPSLMGMPYAQSYSVSSRLVAVGGYAYLVFGNQTTCEHYVQVELSPIGNHRITSVRLPTYELGELLTLDNGGLPAALKPRLSLSGYMVGDHPLSFPAVPLASRRYSSWQQADLHEVSAGLVLLDINAYDILDPTLSRIDRTELGYEVSVGGVAESSLAAGLSGISSDDSFRVIRATPMSWSASGVPSGGFALVVGDEDVDTSYGATVVGGKGRVVMLSSTGDVQSVRPFSRPSVAIPGMAPFIDTARNRLVYPGAVINFWDM